MITKKDTKTKANNKIIITAALPYSNGPIHIGHLAGSFLPADIYARYLRLKCENVIFISGSDEHGVPISISAKKKNISPKEIIDKYHFLNKKNLEDFGISFDIFSRTSNEVHKKISSDFFLKLYNDGKLIEKETEQYYDESAKEFLADRYIRGECPKCGYKDAYGDQCEKCGTTLTPNELINPRSFLSDTKPVLKKTKHWYLPLGQYQKWLEEWILNKHKNWKTNVYGQCKSWLEQGLFDRPITRDLDWGIKVPLEKAKGKVLYVWFDAPIGYISFTKELLGEEYKNLWNCSNTRLVHFIGKDNIVFHCIVFPVMLKAHGDYILPDVICGNEFMNLEGEKISTSRDHALWLKDYLEKYPNQQDVLRYVLCANMPETKDSDFTMEDFKKRNNNELVDTFGNFINRTFTMTQNFFNGEINNNSKDLDFLEKINEIIKKIEDNLNNFHFRDGLNNLMEIMRMGNKYLNDKKPWKTLKEDPKQTKIILNTCIEVVAKVAIICEPFLPFTSEKLCNYLKIKDKILNNVYINNNVYILSGKLELLYVKI